MSLVKRVGRVVSIAAVVAVGLVLGVTGSAWGAFGISAFDGGTFDGAGSAFTQAGGHPDTASTTITMNRITDENGLPGIDGSDLRDVRVDLPAGFIGNPTAMPACPRELRIPSNKQSAEGGFDLNEFCSLSSIVGVAEVLTQYGNSVQVRRFIAPVFNRVPPPGVAAQFTFSFLDLDTTLDATVRSDGDYGVSIVSHNALQLKSVLGTKVTLWGTPADHSHDNQRCMAFFNIAGDGTAFIPDDGSAPMCATDFLTRLSEPWNAPNPANVPVKAFIANPTACTPDGVGLETTLHVDGWEPSRPTDSASFVSHLPPGLPAAQEDWGPVQGPTGCDRVPFDPSFEVGTHTRRADSPSGLSVDLAFPQHGLLNPTGIATGHLKRATVTLPEGWSVSPSAAGGLEGCSDAQSSIGTLLGSACPAASKIGTVEATTPLLEEPLRGSVYVGSQQSDDPSSGRMFRMFIALNNEERGIRVKLPGEIRIDPLTGRIETTFDNNPQVPVDRISLDLKTGPRAPLASPPDCGTKAVVADLTSWSGAAVRRSSDLSVDCPGVQGFGPAFRAGAANGTSGRFSSFLVRIDRADGQEFIDGVEVELPSGVLAKLKGVPVCPQAQAAAGTCGAGARVGSATVGAGPGSNPFYLSGQPVYLAGPYKGAPYSLSVAIRAKAGPFDLGMVVVRQALHVDRTDAHVTVKSDPVPMIVKGVPIRLRSINVDIDRPSFALNPTSCAAKDVKATLHSQQGSTSTQTSRFGAHDCSLLAFKPRLALRLTGKKQTTTGKHPGLRAQVRQTGIGEAAISEAKVALPKSLALDPDNAQALCEFADGTKPDLENHCPKGSIIGRAHAVTPLLGEPLSGNVYFVKNVRRSASGNLIRTLPMIVVALRGKIALNLKGASSTSRSGQLVNTFVGVPDAPVSRFNLNINGGRNGILTVTRTARARIDLCANPRGHLANVNMDGHNAKHADYRTRVKTPCTKTKRVAARRNTAARGS